MRLFGFTLFLLLAGCGSQPAAEKPAAPAPTPKAPMLGGVSLEKPVTVTDAAASWTVELAPGLITLTRLAGQGDGKVSQFYPISPQVDAHKAVWTTKDSEGTEAIFTLTDARCVEAGTPRIERPLTADIRIGASELHGCAGPRDGAEMVGR